MMRRRALLTLVIFALACQGQEEAEPERLAQYAARGLRGAIGAGTELSAEAGMRLFHQGGNAVDAGVAVMFAGSVVEFSHFGFGGESPLLIRTKAGKVYSIAGIGTMPKAASAEYFRTRRIRRSEILSLSPGGMRDMVPVTGLLPALVPGMVEAGLVALREFGTRSFAEVAGPALELAEGFPIDEMRSVTIQRTRRYIELWPEAAAVFLPGGKVPQPGDVFRQPDLARTLRAMMAQEKRALEQGKSREAAIDAVRDYFYRGEIARKIDAFSAANEGLLRYEDLAAFRLEPEEPVSTAYRGHEVYKSGFWSQGPVMLQTLNILEGLPIHNMKLNSADYVHTLTEVFKLAYADRDTYYADPKFVDVPAAKLLSKRYAAARRAQLGSKASLEFRPGDVGASATHPSEFRMIPGLLDEVVKARDTTTINAVDKDGVMFSATPSGAWLPSVIAGDTGIPLTQRAQSFLLAKGHPNELEGGKRPRITLSPTLVTKQGKPFLALSTPGGDNQDQSLTQLLLNVIEFGMSAEAAVEAPRFQTKHLVSSFDNHSMSTGVLLLDSRIDPAVVNEMNRRGHRVRTRSEWSSGSAPTIIRMYPSGVIEAGADPWGYRRAHAW